MKIISYLLCVLCVSNIIFAEDTSITFPGIITNYCAYFTEPKFNKIVTNGYKFNPLDIVNIENNGNLIDDTFIAIRLPQDSKIVYLNKNHIFYQKGTADIANLLEMAKVKMYKDQLESWEISRDIQLIKPEKIILDNIQKIDYVNYSVLEQIPNYKKYKSVRESTKSKYYIDITYEFVDKSVLIHKFKNRNLIGTIILTKGIITNDIYITMKRKELDKVLGVPDKYSTIFSEIESNLNYLKYRTNDFIITFNFERSMQTNDATDYEDGKNYWLKSIEIDNNKNDEEMP